jgi:ABC-type bacteriocin/lantibiotic exporter with double-glycine peptidase domain
MRYVKQRHVNGCAIASLAMVSGISYQKAFNLYNKCDRIYFNDNGRVKGEVFDGANQAVIMMCLEKLGFNYKVSFKKTNPLNIKNNAFISVLSSDKKNFHAFAWNGKKKMCYDPGGWQYTYTKKYIKSNIRYYIELL